MPDTEEIFIASNKLMSGIGVNIGVHVVVTHPRGGVLRAKAGGEL